MDRRLDRRYSTNLEVTVTDIAAQDRVASGRIVDISQSGVCTELALGFAAGSIVKVQTGDCALFGRVTYCTEGRSFRTGIEVVRKIVGASDLARLLNAIFSQAMPATPERKFETYRLSVVQSMPDSDLKDAHIRAIMHKLKRLDAEPLMSGRSLR
jgi:PilZ domain